MANMSKDKMVGLFIESNQKTNEALFGIREALVKINDQNKLHCELVVKNGDKSDRNYEAIAKMIASTNSVTSILKWAFMVLIAAMVALAGAEKIVGLIPVL